MEVVPFLRGWVSQVGGTSTNIYVLDAEAIANYKFMAFATAA
jgi:hypothetical protein